MKKIFIILLLSSSIFAVTIFACENCILGTAAGVGICYPTYLGFTHTCCEKTVWQSPESNARITNFSLCPKVAVCCPKYTKCNAGIRPQTCDGAASCCNDFVGNLLAPVAKCSQSAGCKNHAKIWAQCFCPMESVQDAWQLSPNDQGALSDAPEVRTESTPLMAVAPPGQEM